MRPISSTTAAAALLASAMTALTPAQDIKPDPADVEAVKALLKTATAALLEKDARTFITCCDPYVYCFFADGTLVRGRATIERTLGEHFARRADDRAIRLDVVPRSYRVLSPEIMMIDWPATIREGDRELKVNTLTTVRKTAGRWSITAYLESVPYPLPTGGRQQGRIEPEGR
jgi:SnoaL-like domain